MSAPAPASLEALFAAPAAAIDYSSPAAVGDAVLPVPLPTDSLREIALKVRNLADVVNSNKSLVNYTGGIYAPTVSTDPEAVAMAEMQGDEVRFWTAFRQGHRFTARDWEKDREPVPAGHGNAVAWQNKAHALALLFDLNYRKPYAELPVTVENVAWFYKHLPQFAPAISAALKRVKAERSVTGGLQSATAVELSEYVTCGKISGTANSTRQKIMDEINRMNRSIQTDLNAIQERHRQLGRKFGFTTKFPRPEGPENKVRKIIGMQPITSRFDARAGPSGTRVKRRLDIFDSTDSAPAPVRQRTVAPEQPLFAPPDVPMGGVEEGPAYQPGDETAGERGD
jgi:hypothetical protein